MPECAHCGEDHQDVDPTYGFPDPYFVLDEATRREHAKADRDLCMVSLPGAEPRHFVRALLPVAVHDCDDTLCWGLWFEVSHEAFQTVLRRWSDDDQADEPPMPCTLANDVLGSGTLGLPGALQLTGPSTPPEFRFDAAVEHPFADECRAGIDAARAAQWLAQLLHGAAGD